MQGIGRLILWGLGIVVAFVAIAYLTLLDWGLAIVLVLAAAAFIVALKIDKRLAADPLRRRPVPGDPEPLE